MYLSGKTLWMKGVSSAYREGRACPFHRIQAYLPMIFPDSLFDIVQPETETGGVDETAAFSSGELLESLLLFFFAESYAIVLDGDGHLPTFASPGINRYLRSPWAVLDAVVHQYGND